MNGHLHCMSVALCIAFNGAARLCGCRSIIFFNCSLSKTLTFRSPFFIPGYVKRLFRDASFHIHPFGFPARLSRASFLLHLLTTEPITVSWTKKLLSKY